MKKAKQKFIIPRLGHLNIPSSKLHTPDPLNETKQKKMLEKEIQEGLSYSPIIICPQCDGDIIDGECLDCYYQPKIVDED